MNSDWPISYRFLRANGVSQLVPWHFFEENEGHRINGVFATESIEEIRIKTFAYRQDCDDFAAFVVNENSITDEVIYFHPSFAGAKNSHLINGRFRNLYTFISEVVFPDSEDWTSEEAIEDLLKNPARRDPS